MKKLRFLWMSALGSLLLLAPQTANAGWMRTYGGPLGDGGYRVFQTSDGGYIIAGSTNSFGAGKSDIWLLKTDSLGDTLWTKTYGGSDDEDMVCLNPTLDGGYILAAQTFSFGVYSKSDIWILKTDSLGDTLWTLVYGTENRDFPGYVGERLEGGYVAIGGAADAAYNYKILFISVDAQGKLEYVKDHKGFCTCANKFSDSLYLVVIDNGVLELSSQGDSLWRLWDATVWMTNWIERDNSAPQTYMFTGCEYQNALDVPDLFIGCGDLFHGFAGGAFLGDPSTMEIGLCIRSTTDGGDVVVGEKENAGSGYDLWLIKEGPTSWRREFGGSNDDAGYYVDNTSDGGYIITGITGSYGAGGSDLWLIKTDSLGYVDIEEPAPVTHPVTHLNPIGREITLHYSDCPQGFHASIYDVSGRKVDMIKASGSSGAISWGEGFRSGVYFIRSTSGVFQTTQKVILLK